LLICYGYRTLEQAGPAVQKQRAFSLPGLPYDEAVQRRKYGRYARYSEAYTGLRSISCAFLSGANAGFAQTTGGLDGAERHRTALYTLSGGQVTLRYRVRACMCAIRHCEREAFSNRAFPEEYLEKRGRSRLPVAPSVCR
jgi:hypothetical protein